MINKVVIEGRLAFDPELKHYGAKNTSNVTNTLCCSWYQNAKNQSTFIKVVIWGRVAENIANYCSKGSRVVCIGRLVNNKYTNKNGVEVNEIQLIVEETSFEPKRTNDNVQIDQSVFSEDKSLDLEEKVVTNNDEDFPFF